jgi:DNA/RNA endonuclease G (NUC1)
MVRLFICLAVLFGCAFSQPAVAAHRDCTAHERASADRQLWLNERDKNIALATHLPWGVPAVDPAAGAEWYLPQRNYIIRYDGDLRVPLLTAERVAASKLRRVHRTDCFRRDPRIDSPMDSKPSDFSEPIFDQGHLAAFANQTASIVAGNNSFIMSNMVPQTCQFNRGIWQILEGVVRLWARHYGTVYVFSGSIFDRDGDGHRDADAAAARMTSSNGQKRVAVPTAFFKVVVVQQTDGSVDTETFVMPHNEENPNGDAAVEYLQSHLTTLAAVEAATGLQLFPMRPLIREAQSLWPFDRSAMPNSLCHDQTDPRFRALWEQ